MLPRPLSRGHGELETEPRTEESSGWAVLAASEEAAKAGDYEAALDSAESARDVFRESRDAIGEAEAALAAARALLCRGGKSEEALPAAREAQRLGQAVASSGAAGARVAAGALQVLAQVLIKQMEDAMQSSNWETGGPDLNMMRSVSAEAAKAAMGALQLSRDAKDEPSQAFALYLAGHAYLLGQKHDEACRFALRAHSFFRALKDPRMAGAASLTLAQAYCSQEKNDKALVAAKEAMSLSSTAKDPLGVDGAKQILEVLMQDNMETACMLPCRRL